MRYLIILFTTLPLAAATQRYIVELSEEPAAAHAARVAPGRGRAALATAAARTHRARLDAQQETARRYLEQQGARVTARVATVINALIVDVPEGRSPAWSRVPGLKRLHKERMFHPALDHALPLHKVPDVWNQVGMDNAGAGVKIGFIDTGIDNSHPALQDSSLPIPDGFPKTDTDADRAFTNNKIIVARYYGPPSDSDPTARDHQGHGTSTAMCAAGAPVTGPRASITGVAPKAWLGNYNVFGSDGGSASDSAILQALDDAVNDGMDVINLSLGSDVAEDPSVDPEVQAISNAAALGVIVVVAAGNNGPDPATVGTPGDAPDAITVGASNNDRTFASSVTLPDGTVFTAVNAAESLPGAPLSAPLSDIAAVDSTSLACSPLPSQSLSGSIALIRRGTCTFEIKLNNAQAAGAVATLVYDQNDGEDPITMGVGSATLPAQMVGYQDGLALKHLLTAGSVTISLDFSVAARAVSPDKLASFSAHGPAVDASLKPDLVAVGTRVYTAVQSWNSDGELYSPSGFALLDGTSYSSPIVAGAAALLKAARPGLTVAQYRSLLVNTAGSIGLLPGSPARVQQAGAGVLNVSAAFSSTGTVNPTSLNLGWGSADPHVTTTLTLGNIGTDTETYLLSVAPRDGDAAAPSIDSGTVQLAPGASADLHVSFSGTALAPGQYEGCINVQGQSSGTQLRVPYWYAVASRVPRTITILDSPAAAPAPGQSLTNAFLFHVVDASGLILKNAAPAATVVAGDGAVVSVRSRANEGPGVYGLSVALGKTPGANTFRIQAGDVSLDVTITTH